MPSSHRSSVRLTRLAAPALLAVASCAAPSAVPPPQPVPLPEYPPRAQTTPRPALAAPRAGQGAADSLAGTVWAGADSDGDAYTFEFRAGGLLHYVSPTGTYDNGTWAQEGDRVTMEMNHHYSDYEGLIRGRRIEGKARNTAGAAWTWSAEKR
jgi:hypothetical protein